MSRFAEELPHARRSYARAVLLDEGVSPKSLRGPGWESTTYGFHRRRAGRAAGAPSPGPSPTQRIVDALALVPPGGAIGGWAAAFVHGVDWSDGGVAPRERPVPIVLGATVDRMPPDARSFRGLLAPDEIVLRHGLPVTSLQRTAFDSARWEVALPDAVAALDGILRFTTLDARRLGDWLPRVAGWRGVRQVRAALALSDPRVRSPWESRLRVLYVTEVAPGPLVNCPVVDTTTGRVVAEVDLLDEPAGLVIEFDGAHHRAPTQHHEDNLREEELERLNLVVVRVDALDLTRRPALGRRLRDARRRGLARDRARDRWAVDHRVLP